MPQLFTAIIFLENVLMMLNVSQVIILMVCVLKQIVDSLLVKNTYPRARLLGPGPSFSFLYVAFCFLICKGEIVMVYFSYEHCDD